MAKSARNTPSPGPIPWLTPLYADAGPILARRPKPEVPGPYPWLGSLYLPDREPRRIRRSEPEATAADDAVDADDAVEQNEWMAEVLGRIPA